MNQLGLQRRARRVPQLDEYLAQREGGAAAKPAEEAPDEVPPEPPTDDVETR